MTSTSQPEPICPLGLNSDPLQRLIDLWENIYMLHYNAMIEKKPDGHGVYTHNFREQSRLRDKAQMVVSALTHYKIELER